MVGNYVDVDLMMAGQDEPFDTVQMMAVPAPGDHLVYDRGPGEPDETFLVACPRVWRAHTARSTPSRVVTLTLRPMEVR